MEFSPRAAELTTLLESRISHFYTNLKVADIFTKGLPEPARSQPIGEERAGSVRTARNAIYVSD